MLITAFTNNHKLYIISGVYNPLIHSYYFHWTPREYALHLQHDIYKS